MKIKIILAALILLCTIPATAEKYYMVLGNSFQGDTPRPVLSRYIYDTENPTKVVPAPAKGLEGAALVSSTENSFSGLAFYNGKIFASCTKTGSVIKFDAYTGAKEGTIITGLISPAGLTIGPDKNIYVACKDYIARYTLTGKPKPGVDNYGDVFSSAGSFKYGDGITFDKKGNLFVCSQGSGEILQISIDSGEYKRSFARGQGVFSDIKVGTDGHLYVSVTGIAGIDNKGFVAILDRESNKLEPKILDGNKDPYGLTFTPDNKLVVTSYSDGGARLYDNYNLQGLLGTQVGGERDYRILFYKISQ